MPLFGGRRAIRVRAGSRSFASGVDTLAEMNRRRIAASSSRPASCGRNRRCARPARRPRPRWRSPAIADTERDLAQADRRRTAAVELAHRAGRARRADGAARRRPPGLAQRDCASSRSTRTARARSRSTTSMAVVSDASDLALDPIVDSRLCRQPRRWSKRIRQGDGRRHLSRRRSSRPRSARRRGCTSRALAMAEGTPLSSVLEGGFPRLHFSRKGAVETALRNFSPPAAGRESSMQLGDGRARHAQAGRAGRQRSRSARCWRSR